MLISTDFPAMGTNSTASYARVSAQMLRAQASA